jgi:hypothetical protein
MYGRFTQNSQSTKIHFCQSLLQNSMFLTCIMQIVSQSNIYLTQLSVISDRGLKSVNLFRGVFPNLLSRLGIY